MFAKAENICAEPAVAPKAKLKASVFVHVITANPSAEAVKIGRIWLDGGSPSMFSLRFAKRVRCSNLHWRRRPGRSFPALKWSEATEFPPARNLQSAISRALYGSGPI